MRELSGWVEAKNCELAKVKLDDSYNIITLRSLQDQGQRCL